VPGANYLYSIGVLTVGPVVGVQLASAAGGCELPTVYTVCEKRYMVRHRIAGVGGLEFLPNAHLRFGWRFYVRRWFILDQHPDFWGRLGTPFDGQPNPLLRFLENRDMAAPMALSSDEPNTGSARQGG
jgi:hypothetical protein